MGKKNTLVAIGNALVDMEFEVSEAFLQENKLAKGMMELIDYQQYQHQFEELKNLFGITKKVGGGSAANSAVVCSQLGAKTAYICQLGNDSESDFYRKDLLKEGVSCFSSVIGQICGKCMVMVSSDAERTMQTYLGASAKLNVEAVDFNILRQAEYLFLEGYLVSLPEPFEVAKKAIAMAKQYQVKVALSFSDPSMVRFFHSQVSELVALGIDVLFANQEEVHIWAKEQDLSKAIKKLKQSVAQVVITQGKQGSLHYGGSEEVLQVAGVPTSVVDTNGAGDVFAGAYLYGIMQGLTMELAGKLANTVAAKMVSQFGARLPKQEVLKTRQAL